MAAVAHSDSKGMYSWWWDSHISPKNSKWLQENLYDMDEKVRQMIKLIEQDADSFAQRAEMYYKKRPELMKLVEGFYRAYRAMAERYDHATVVIRQAHRTMAEAFPNQVPPVPPDDLIAVTSTDSQPCTPGMLQSSLAFLASDKLHKEVSSTSLSLFHDIKRNGAFIEEPDSATSGRRLKQLNDLFISGEHLNHRKFTEGRARKGLNFLDVEEQSNDTRTQGLSESERMVNTETEILALKRALNKLEGEKEAGLVQYQQSMERLSNLELEVSHTQENSRGLDERASKAEAEVQTLKDVLIKLQAEREASLVQYQQCLEKILNLENKISSVLKDAGEFDERAAKTETEANSLKQDLARAEVEKEAALVQYKQCLEMASNLEGRLVQAEENAKRINEQANKAENELEAMKLEIAKLTREQEDATLRYQQCLDTISSLEHKLSSAEEEMHRLTCNVHDKAEKLESSEQECLLLETSNKTLQSELQSLVQKMGSHSEELNEKQKELGRLWTCVQEERLRFIETETAFQNLQHLHSQSQEEHRSLALELHNKAETLENVESCKQALKDEVQRVKEENQTLHELKSSSSLSIKILHDEISNLRDTIAKLEQEVKLRVEQRNSLQQEIYWLKKELNDVNKRHEAMISEVRSTGFDPQCFLSSVKNLQDENSKLKETCEADRSEKAALLEKLEIMEKLMEKNAVLENSLSDLNIELESVREKVKLLEETCHSLLEEKSALASEKAASFSQLQATIEKLEKLAEKNKLLENSIFDLNAELEGLRVKSKVLENSCNLLDHVNSSLISEKDTLLSQFNCTHQTLKFLEKQRSELEMKHLELKGEKESALQKVEELLASLYVEREEHSRIVGLNKIHLAEKELEFYVLQDNAKCQKKEYEEELDRSVNAQIENFIFQNCIQDMEKKNFSLVVEYQTLLEASKKSEELISKLEKENVQKRVDMNSLCERTSMESERLKERVSKLENENGRLRDQLAAYVPAVSALDNCISSLELLTIILAKSRDNAEQKVNNLVKKQDIEGSAQTGGDMIMAQASFPDFQHLQKRINAIEMAMKQMNGSFKRKDKLKEIQGLKSGSSQHLENIQISKRIDETKDELTDEQVMGKSVPEISYTVNEVLPKDIMLDQMSECSSYGLSKRETLEVDDQMLELWEITDRDSSIGLTVGKAQKMATRPSNYHHRRAIKQSRSKLPSAESLVEEELSVDKLEISNSRRFSEPREESSKRKLLDRLDSDAQKLTNLHIVVQDLVKKVEITKQTPMGNDIEYDTVKRQLEAAEETITRLFDTNRKLLKKVRDGTVSFGGKQATDSDESSESINRSRRRALEQARRASEKIGRLQMDVQRLQFLLLKLDDEKESKGRARITNRTPRVILRDYLYGGTRSRTIQKRKKAHFCGCVQPPTKG